MPEIATGLSARRHPRRRWVLWSVGSVFVGGLLAVALAALVASRRFPDELRRRPAALEGLPEPEALLGAAPTSPSLSRADAALRERLDELVQETAAGGSWADVPEGEDGRPSAEQMSWLEAHQALIGALRRLIESDAPRRPVAGNPVIAVSNARMLAAEAERLMQQGDAAAACATLADLYRMPNRRGETILEALLAGAILDRANLALARWLEQGALNPDQAAALASAIAAAPSPRDDFSVGLRGEWLVMRNGAIGLADAPFPQAVKELMASGTRSASLVSRAGKFGVAVWSALDLKVNAPDYVAALDGGMQAAFGGPAPRYADLAGLDLMQPVRQTLSRYNWVTAGIPRTGGLAARAFASQARQNLVRQGLEIVRPGEATPITQIDPFNDEPLKSIILPDGSRLLYSVGEDLKDDGGRVESNSANDAPKGGDIVLRIPRKTE